MSINPNSGAASSNINNQYFPSREQIINKLEEALKNIPPPSTADKELTDRFITHIQHCQPEILDMSLFEIKSLVPALQSTLVNDAARLDAVCERILNQTEFMRAYPEICINIFLLHPPKCSNYLQVYHTMAAMNRLIYTKK